MQPQPNPQALVVRYVILALAILAVLYFIARRQGKSLQTFLFSGTPGSMILGLLLGGLVGFLLRPAVPLVGQLPFTVVITRGSNLTGLDQMLVSAAKTSFNYLAAGGLIGALAGVALTQFIRKR